MTSPCLAMLCRVLRQRRVWFPLCCLLSLTATKMANAGDPQKIRFGVFNNFALNSPQFSFQPEHSSLGLFVNYNFSEKLYVQVEYEKKDFLSQLFDDENSGKLENLYQQNWSTSVLLNYHFKSTANTFSPFIGLGAGQYYIYDSKRVIKHDKANPADESLDYELREYLRKPGVFGTVGIHFQPTNAMTFFVESRCSILFREEGMMLEPSPNFTDLMAITAGLKFNLN